MGITEETRQEEMKEFESLFKINKPAGNENNIY